MEFIIRVKKCTKQKKELLDFASIQKRDGSNCCLQQQMCFRGWKEDISLSFLLTQAKVASVHLGLVALQTRTHPRTRTLFLSHTHTLLRTRTRTHSYTFALTDTHIHTHCLSLSVLYPHPHTHLKARDKSRNRKFKIEAKWKGMQSCQTHEQTASKIHESAET